VRLLDINGKLKPKSVIKYLIKWDGKSRSKVQKAVKQFLKKYWSQQIVYEEFPVFGSKMKVDFVNATKKIAIEVNGKQHENFNQHFHAKSRLVFLNSIIRDYRKQQWLESNGFKFVQIEEDEVKNLSPEFFKERFEIDLV
jgi:very-short-patch-repair endonuclease